MRLTYVGSQSKANSDVDGAVVESQTVQSLFPRHYYYYYYYYYNSPQLYYYCYYY